jgi:hypothetical protein
LHFSGEKCIQFQKWKSLSPFQGDVGFCMFMAHANWRVIAICFGWLSALRKPIWCRRHSAERPEFVKA